MDNKTKRLYMGLMALYACSMPMLSAQEVSEDDVIILEEVEADDVPIEESILATTRPITSVYGTERSVLDTPRNVNIISREQLDAISIKDVRDFSKLTSSSYTKTNFGAPTSPNLRGQEADLMINGIRRGHSTNGNGVPINFNSVESVNIVKGPAGAVYGTSGYVGGYADLITKRAYFEDGGSAEYSWGSFGQHTINLDYNVALSDTLAVRVSMEGKDWKGFYDRWYQESQAVYAAVAWKPNDKYRLDVMTEFYKGNYTENWGINRVTQDLIDHGLYIPNAQTDAEYAAYVARLGDGTSVFFTPDPTSPSLVGAAGFSTVAPLDLANPVKIDRSSKLSAPGDDSNAVVFWTEAIQEYIVSDSLKIVNSSMFHYKDRDTFSSYHYSELMRDNFSIDNRFQLIQDFEFSDESMLTMNYGLRTRYQDIWSVNHFFNEPVNFWDLTRDPELTRIPDAGFAGTNYLSDQSPRGVLDKWYVGGGEAVDTQTFFVGPFAQGDYQINEKWSVLAGITAEYVHHKQGLPSSLVDSTGTPLPKGTTRDDVWLFNGNTSIVFKPTETSSLYATVNLGENTRLTTGGATTRGSVVTPSETSLYELGYNASFLDGKLYLGTAVFRQEYDRRSQNGDVTTVSTDGFEIELNYQPNRNFFATIGYSFLDSTTAFPAGSSPMASTYTADLAGLTGGNYITPSFDSLATDQEFESAGTPDHLINALAQYKFDNGFGVQANVLFYGEMNSGYEGYDISVLGQVPAGTQANTASVGIQHEIDAKIFFEYENWRIEFAVFNLTDEENWDFNNSLYANGSAVARPERSYEISLEYEW